MNASSTAAQLLVGWMQAPLAPESTTRLIRTSSPQHLVDCAALHPPYGLRFRSVIFQPGNAFLGEFAGLGIDPVGESEFRLGFLDGFARLDVGLILVLHVLDRLDQGSKRPCFAAVAPGLPVKPVGALDDSRLIVIGGCFGNDLAHKATPGSNG